MKAILIAVAALVLMSCGKKEQTFGEAIPASTPVTALSEVLKSPEKFHEKEVTLKGTIAAQCGNRCEFTFRDGNESVTIYVGDIEAPLMQKGTPIDVTASVFQGEKKLILTAKGFSLGTKGGK